MTRFNRFRILSPTVFLALLPVVPGAAQTRPAAPPPPELPLMTPGENELDGRRIPEYDNAWRFGRILADGSWEERGIWRDRVRIEHMDGREVIRRVQLVTSVEGRETEHLDLIDRRTMASIHVRYGPKGSPEPAYRADYAEGGAHVASTRAFAIHNASPGQPTVRATMQLTLAQPVYDWHSWGLLVAALPLAEGYRARLLTHAPIVDRSASPLLEARVEVVGVDTLALPGHPAVECWVVGVDIDHEWTFWIPKDRAPVPIAQIDIRPADESAHALWWRPRLDAR